MNQHDLVAEAITEAMGPRCAEHDPNCLSCRTSAQYDQTARLILPKYQRHLTASEGDGMIVRCDGLPPLGGPIQIQCMAGLAAMFEMALVRSRRVQTLERVDWFNNRRLIEPVGNIPPAGAEAAYYAQLEVAPIAA